MKERFSDRIGITNPPAVFQIEEMSVELRNSLWNLIVMTFNPYIEDANILVKALCVFYFRDRIDDLPYDSWKKMDWLKDRFFSKNFNWYDVYNLMEFLIKKWDDIPFYQPIQLFIGQFNQVLEEEYAGYRVMNNEIIPITNKGELDSLESAIDTSHFKNLKGAAKHLETAIQLFSRKPEPDYRNSIKESISAVESVVKQITGEIGGGLDKALNLLDEKVKFHQAFKQGLLKLYGYTSDDKGGIRHAILEEKEIGFDEAKFMLVSCSALVNFLIAKADKAGLLTSSKTN